ncbi:dual specificity protein phosphatase 16-like [Oppia nitens]|uniref:dual specificity protein phosphatase 16-like n=1 Tax=Oppia nitens TaxID=1686743 RepID=UPI0023DA5C96|nr:dual specificity protein phosphatase 16-like [Oppia nitens]XP_054159109.1 dual specificity protein phosphatase 16-like [Oppia nitens]
MLALNDFWTRVDSMDAMDCTDSTDMLNTLESIELIESNQLADITVNRLDNILIIDSRSFLEYNTCHISYAVNVNCSKIVKRRLQQNKISINELLVHTCQCQINNSHTVIVYDQQSTDVSMLSSDSFVTILLSKLSLVFKSVSLLRGGFLDFQSAYPTLCENKAAKGSTTLTSLSQPCMPISNHGPTRILPFLYLGSQQDALNRDTLRDHNINYELNVSTSCPKPEFIPDTHFLRIAVNDNYNENLLSYFPKAFNFLDKVRESGGCVIVHCLAGISRSATVAISYVMRHLCMSSDDAYRYVKSKRATISPNFNFLGQLLEYEKQLIRERVLSNFSEDCSRGSQSAPICSSKMSPFSSITQYPSIPRPRKLNFPTKSITKLDPFTPTPPDENTSNGDQSPTSSFKLVRIF